MNPSETLATSIEGSTGDYASLTGTQLANGAESDIVPEEDVLLGDLLKLMTINQKKTCLTRWKRKSIARISRAWHREYKYVAQIMERQSIAVCVYLAEINASELMA